MKRINLRIDDYLYNEIMNMAKFYNVSANILMTELLQIGIIEKEKMILSDE